MAKKTARKKAAPKKKAPAKRPRKKAAPRKRAKKAAPRKKAKKRMTAATKRRLAGIRKKRNTTDSAMSGVVKRTTRQTGKSNRRYDRRVQARPPGLRVSKSGNLYRENRRNRSDLGPLL
jgi:hypothetical protein